ncbi:PAS domain S-box protein [Desulfobaculum bizertense]|uniref:PAS domain S-box-containing protein n=1 Tax=Desulfobaculum bizertense DSM 18034 TaxID=1121442 RepID=A0A1T4VW03_9BACT|nr:PAS domain S-box protein [Desulfobaculum bizertense]SKA69137.1 PAS domain S-box-containing protein [Desulfobaculum bizertense DSM 18034]
MDNTQKDADRVGLKWQADANVQLPTETQNRIFFALFDGLSEPCFVKNSAYEYVFVNAAAAKLLDRSAHEIIGRRAAELFGAEAGMQMEAHDRAVLAEEPVNDLCCFQTWGRSERHLRCDKRVHLDPASGEKYLIVFLRPERIPCLSNGESLALEPFLHLSEVSSQAILVADAETVVFANPGAARLLECSVSEMVGKPYLDFVVPECVESVRLAHHARLVGKADRPDFETQLLTPNSGKKWVRIRSMRIRWRGQSAILKFLSDITEQVKAQQELQESQKTLRKVLDLVPHAIFACDADGRYLFVNQHSSKIRHANFEHLVGTRISDYSPCVDSDCQFPKLSRKVVLSNEPRHKVDIECSMLKGHIFETSLIPFVYDHKPACLGISVDVTSERTLQRRMENLVQTLLGLGVNHRTNLEKLVELCGSVLGADFASYNSLRGEQLFLRVGWNVSPNTPVKSPASGHLATDVILQRLADRLCLVRNLGQSAYASTDSFVQQFGAKTYMGMVVMSGEKALGALSLYFRDDFEPDYQDECMVAMIASAIAAEDDRMRAKALMQERELQHQATFERVAVGMTRTDGKGVFQDVNQCFCELTGYSRDELLALRYSDVGHPRELRRNKELYEKLISGELRNYDLEKRFRRKDGSYVWVRVTASAVPALAGGTWVSTLVLDISDRMRAESQLERRDQQLRKFMQYSPAGISFKDVDLNILLVNRSWRRFMGIPRDIDVSELSLQEYIPESLYRDCREQDLYILRTGRSLEFEQTMNLPLGQRTFLTAKFPLRDARGETWGIGSVLTDISSRKRFEQALRENELKFRMLFEHASDALLLHTPPSEDAPGRFLEVNAKACSLLGYTKPQLLGMDPEHYVGAFSIVRGSRQLYERRLHDASGEEIVAELSSHSFDLSGRSVVMTIMRDVSERKRMERTLLRRDAVLETVGFASERFLQVADWDSGLPEVLERLGDAAGVERVFILRNENENHHSEVLKYSLYAGWNALSVKPLRIGTEYDVGVYHDDNDGIVNVLMQGEIFHSKTSQFSSRTSSLFLEQNIGSIVLIPVFAGKAWWGTLALGAVSAGRIWYSPELEALNAAAKMLGHAVVRSRMEQALRVSSQRFELIAKTVGEAFWISRLGRRNFEYFSPALNKWLGRHDGVRKMEQAFEEALEPEDRERVFDVYADRSAQSYELEYRLHCRDGAIRWIRERASTVRDGAEIYLAGVSIDITESKQNESSIRDSLREKELLLREVHHRVKNNLQVISSLLDMAARRVKDPSSSDIMRDLQGKIHSMSVVHLQLYSCGNLENIKIADYVQLLMTQLARMYGVKDFTPVYEQMDDIRLPLDLAIPCGLVLSEVLSNAFKHAFRGSGKINELRVAFINLKENCVQLRVKDNGPGLPENFDYEHAKSLGLKLMRNIVTLQLGGSLEMRSNNGTEITVTFGNDV